MSKVNPTIGEQIPKQRFECSTCGLVAESVETFADPDNHRPDGDELDDGPTGVEVQ